MTIANSKCSKSEISSPTTLIRFHPIYKVRVWGGRALESELGRSLPSGKIIGESWDLVDREEDQSIVSEGVFAGWTLRQLLETHADTIMGLGWDPRKPFPILVKWLDCQQRLSLQVHPPAPIAPTLGGEPKTENWYILRSRPKAGLLVGLRHGVTRNDFIKALKEKRLEACVHRIPATSGDSILVESGRLHAIDAGNLILEIQQNSDTTYRVYDWGRSGLDGKPRQLHIEESLQSIDFDDFEPDVLSSSTEPGQTTLADCSEFRIRKQNLAVGAEERMDSRNTAPEILHIAKGALHDSISGMDLTAGDTVLLPAGATAHITAKEDLALLRTDRFTTSFLSSD